MQDLVRWYRIICRGYLHSHRLFLTRVHSDMAYGTGGLDIRCKYETIPATQYRRRLSRIGQGYNRFTGQENDPSVVITVVS